ncbi:aldehyde dehydrogenase family protein [uncultured Marinobacter sp.]|uniref:aldehyde dehydrogenase family protein n=1 Tax=uncultured Marinobacter sp. TaxID=187379 RepID=UPI0030DD3BA3
MTAAVEKPHSEIRFGPIDQAVAELEASARNWARMPPADKVEILEEIRDRLNSVASAWAKEAARQKQIPKGSPLEGEEWMSGPFALMTACNLLIDTLSGLNGKTFLRNIPLRRSTTGQVVAKILPHSIWDKLLLSGVNAEVWMQKGVTESNLASNTASAHDVPLDKRPGRVCLVLGAGNIAAIPPLDCFQKLFTENQVVLLKMNPVNEYLDVYLKEAFKPLIECGALRMVRGGVGVGRYLCNHPTIEEIHITGSALSHDAIIWGMKGEQAANKAAGTPKNSRRITSELGAVCPTIVVPGPWTTADLDFQAEHIATQKLHNSGFNCVACQMLILPDNWALTNNLMTRVEKVMAQVPGRSLYYPGAAGRMEEFSAKGDNVLSFKRPGADACVVTPLDDVDDASAWFKTTEVFAPAMSTRRLAAANAEQFLRQAVAFANDELYGTLGANILIHPDTIEEIGEETFEDIIAELRYGTIAINAWTGLGFLMPQCPWGAFPGHTLDDVQSGIGFVHNTYMFDKVERCVIRAPFRPFPRSLLGSGFSLLPRPPWFVTNRKQHKIGRLLTRFQYRPSWLKVPRIFLNALLG